MEQRTLRLGDIVDDYCPRERRVTNHAIVAIVENSIRQTRCSTCDAEHEYKEAKVPLKKKRGPDGADLAGGVLVTPKPAASPVENGIAGDGAEPEAAAPDAPSATATAAEPGSASENGGASEAPGPAAPDGWFSHRPLIRASLPRTDNDPPPPRPIPEFTMHQRQGRGFGGRGGGFRHGHQGGGGQAFRGGGHGNGQPNGNEPDGNRAPQPGGRPGGGPGGGGGRRRRRRRPR